MQQHSPSHRTLDIARDTLEKESAALREMAGRLTEDFVRAVELIGRGGGRVILTGIGKSAIVAQKIAATFNSTGTPALFMHAGDAIHGDLGMVQPGDIVLCLSKSGESPEIRALVPLVRSFGNPLLAIVGQTGSLLARQADLVLDATVTEEACPNNLAPTASTTAQMAMGDALAVCLMELRGFSPEDFARFHPGGTLGRKLYLRVEDLAARNARPEVRPQTPLKEVIVEMTEKRLGMTLVTGEDGHIAGIVTDGDLRRMLRRNPSWDALTAADVMTTDPKTIEADALAVTALDLLRRHHITQLVVLNKGRYAGVIHLHDLVREGLL